MLPIVDLFILICILALFGYIGFHFRHNVHSSSSEYFMAQRKMSILPAAVSISVSTISSTTLTVYQGEVVMYGFPFYAYILSSLLATPIAVVFILHRFYDSNYLSVFQFLEERFSRSVRIINSVVFVISKLINIAIVGYSVTISAETLAGIPFWISAVMTGMLATVYSSMGGIRAVIWTDVCQALLMILFLLFICFKGLLSFESMEDFIEIVSSGRRATIRFGVNPMVRYNVQSCVAHFVVFGLYSQVFCQTAYQRWRSVETLSKAKRTVIISMIFNTLYYLLCFASGITLYAFYTKCSTDQGPFPNTDKISLYFVLKELSSWPSAQGFCLAGLLSGALSTMSSFLNALAAVTLEDFVKLRFKNLDQKLELVISKALTAFYGATCTALIFVAAQSKAVEMIQVVVLAVSSAPVLASFFLGMWTKRANTAGVCFGLCASVAIVSWLSIGSYFYGYKSLPIPNGKQQCPSNTSSLVANVEQKILLRLQPAGDQAQSSFLERVYGMSFFWYSLVGISVSFLLGYISSICITAAKGVLVKEVPEPDRTRTRPSTHLLDRFSEEAVTEEESTI